MVRLRLKRMGRRHRPFYRLNAIEKRAPRDGRVIEPLGWFDPMVQDPEKAVSLKPERIKYWLSQGAQPSDAVMDLLIRHDVVDGAEYQADRERRLAKKRASIVEAKQAEIAAKEAEAKAKAEEEAKAAAEAKAAEEAAAAEAAEGEGDGGE